MRILSLKCDRQQEDCAPAAAWLMPFSILLGRHLPMIFNRYRLTPQQQQKVSAKANELQYISDSQYLIANRLRELAVLLKEKRTQFAKTQLRIQTNGSSSVLVRELAQQKEQIEDLLQLGEDWRNLLGLCQKPDLTELSSPLKVMLRSLGIQATA